MKTIKAVEFKGLQVSLEKKQLQLDKTIYYIMINGRPVQGYFEFDTVNMEFDKTVNLVME